MSQVKLGLDEASISINKSAANSLAADPILVLYQIDECYGCPLELAKRLEGDDRTVVLGTKHLIELELRRIKQQQQHLTNHNHNHNNEGSSGLVCKFAKLSLASHARYQIDISQETANQTNSSPFNCNLRTIDDGECSYCPFALLFFVLLLVTAIEKVYTNFVGRNLADGSRRRDIVGAGQSIDPATITGNQKQQQQAEASADPTAENNNTLQLEEASQVAVGASDSNEQQPTQQRAANREDIEDGVNSDSGLTANRSVSEAGGSQKTRIESLDAFRGLTIAGMIVVNYGGAGYKALEHQPWDGLTVADLVFPYFIFSMGASIALSTRSLVKQGKGLREIFVKICRRSCILMALGLCLNSKWLNIQTQGLDELRLTGVLQRFSVSYLVVASMYAIKLSVIKWIKAQSLYRVPFVSRLVGIVFEYLTALNYLAVYLYVTFFLEYSDTCPAGYVGPGGMTESGRYVNCTGGAAAWLDQTLLGSKHLYHDHEVMEVFKARQTHDPEGLLGNTTSILLTLVGLQCGKTLAKSRRSNSLHKQRLQSFFKWQLILAFVSLSGLFIPINKRLWSLPFVSVTALCAFALMTLLYTLLDIYQIERTFLLRLLISAGKNPIFLYVGHSLLAGMLPWQFYVDQSSHLQLLLRLSWSVLCWLLIAHYMASKRLFIRV